MKTKLKVCDRCLCSSCNDTNCKELACSNCNLEDPTIDCEGYKEEEWEEIRHKIIDKRINEFKREHRGLNEN